MQALSAFSESSASISTTQLGDSRLDQLRDVTRGTDSGSNQLLELLWSVDVRETSRVNPHRSCIEPRQRVTQRQLIRIETLDQLRQHRPPINTGERADLSDCDISTGSCEGE